MKISLITDLLFVFLILLNAFIDSRLIKKNIWINHTLEVIIFSILNIAFIYFFKLNFIKNCLYIVVARIGLFDFSLNTFRGLNLFYISPNAFTNNPKTSIWDKILKENANYIRLIFLIIFIIINIKKYG